MTTAERSGTKYGLRTKYHKKCTTDRNCKRNMSDLIMYITELLIKCDLQNRSAALAPFCKKFAIVNRLL